MEWGKIVNTGGIELTSGEIIEELESDKGNKYLGILKADGIFLRAKQWTRKMCEFFLHLFWEFMENYRT